ncbi:MAG: SMP-30/gluconolactonase/LRE family protein [Anaerolineales bacterium]
MVRRTFTLRTGIIAIMLATMIVPAVHADAFPEILPLPNGFRPEGIAVGRGTDFYVGSLADGAIYKGDLRTGEGDILVSGQAGRVAVGLKFDKRSGRLFVAGGPTGSAYVYDARSGQEVGVIQLTTSGSFINDVVVTRSAAFFTDSSNAVLYKVPLSRRDGLPAPSDIEALPLTGDWEQVPNAFNANGIAATPNGKHLIVVNSTVGALYRVDPDTGEASRIDLGGETVASGDGLLLDGKTLYVVRNFLNQIAVVELDKDLSTGEVTGTITNPAFRIPTTVAEFGNALYTVNARFDVTPGPDVEYEVVRTPKQ